MDAITLVKKHGAKSWEMLHGPEVPLVTQFATREKANSQHARGVMENETYEAMRVIQCHDIKSPMKYVKPSKAKADKEAKAQA